MTPSLQQVVESITKALNAAETVDAGHSPAFKTCLVYRRLENECSPIAIRTLLTAHEEAQAVIAGLREALIRLEAAVDWHLGRSGFTQSTQLKGTAHGEAVSKELYAAHDAARAALQSNKEQP